MRRGRNATSIQFHKICQDGIDHGSGCVRREDVPGECVLVEVATSFHNLDPVAGVRQLGKTLDNSLALDDPVLTGVERENRLSDGGKDLSLHVVDLGHERKKRLDWIAEVPEIGVGGVLGLGHPLAHEGRNDLAGPGLKEKARP